MEKSAICSRTTTSRQSLARSRLRAAPLHEISGAPGGTTLFPVGDFDGRTGTIYQYDHPLLEDAEPPHRLEGAIDALPGTVEYLQELDALAYRTPTEDGQRLRVHFLTSKFAVDLPNEVSDYEAVVRPFSGMVYIVPRGEDAGTGSREIGDS